MWGQCRKWGYGYARLPLISGSYSILDEGVTAFVRIWLFFFLSTRDFFIGLYSIVRYPKIVFDLQFI